MQNFSLYELTSDYARAIHQLADEPDKDRAGQILDSIAEPLRDKAVRVGLFMRGLDVTEQALVAEIDRLQDHLKAITTKRERLHSSIETAMRVAGMTEIEHPLLTIKFKKNPPSVDVLCEADVPAEFWKQPPPPPRSIDKRALLAALKDGDVPGACLKQTERLTIG
jgi:hypothetical protein